MAITETVYGLLLAGYQQGLQTTIPWVDTVLHRLIPLVMVADWLIDPPYGRLTLRQAAIWLAYPLLYAAYSLIRGPRSDGIRTHSSIIGEWAAMALSLSIALASPSARRSSRGS